jgi:hypothetical protein
MPPAAKKTAAPAPTPTPAPPVPAGQKWYQDATFLGWLFSQVVSIVVLVMALAGRPIDTNLWQSVASTAALVISGVTTAVFVHAKGQLNLQREALAHARWHDGIAA